MHVRSRQRSQVSLVSFWRSRLYYNFFPFAKYAHLRERETIVEVALLKELLGDRNVDAPLWRIFEDGVVEGEGVFFFNGLIFWLFNDQNPPLLFRVHLLQCSSRSHLIPYLHNRKIGCTRLRELYVYLLGCNNNFMCLHASILGSILAKDGFFVFYCILKCNCFGCCY